ncbi:MAG: DUF1330 domain-containing protein [Candidatus Omnitrophica bacterium]|nr:DUF1330 domain-containing protein [Candidatus Omnitrophota bacterium]
MSVYFIVEIKTKSEGKEKYTEYIEKVTAIVEKYKGKYLARGGKVTPVFGNWSPERMILIEFPSAKDVERWLNSAEYKEIALLREQSTATKAIVIDGCDK